MNTVNTPMEHPGSTVEMQPAGAIISQHTESTDVLKQRSHQCALATTNLSASLALAATLCIDAGSNGSDMAIPLLVGSAAAAEMVAAYEDLTRDDPQEHMYEIQYPEPIALSLPQTARAFERVLQDFATSLLQLNLALRSVHLSEGRLRATMEELRNNRHDQTGAFFLDAQLFSTLQQQALWRSLKLCTTFHNDLLLLTPRINVLWHQFRLQMPSQTLFGEHGVCEMLNDIWKVRAQDMAAYDLNIFGITDDASILHILAQQGRTLTDPVLLVQEEWHKSTSLLTQTFQHALDTFYTSDMPGLLNAHTSA